VFYKYELEKTAFALDRANISDKDQLAIIKFIQIQTDKGLKLPIDTKLALENKIHLSGVLKIFYNISNNQEIIPQHLFDVLTEKFDPKSNEKMIDDMFDLIGIFENAVKNNQTLSKKILDKLEIALNTNSKLKDKSLRVFVYLAQKGWF
jgi:hypothetical protein